MNGAAPQLQDRIAEAFPSVVMAIYAVVCAAGLWRVLATIGLHVPLDPNEGWNAYLAAAAMAGHPYPDAHGYFVNNYPPLSFYIVDVFGSIVGDNIIAGRIVSLVAFLCVAAGIFQAARFMGCRALHAAFASLLFMAWLIVSTDYVGMNDPQLFAHAIQIAGLLLVLRSTPNDIAAAALFALAIFVKHNLVTMPAAVGLWLLMTDRARARRFIGAGFAFLLSGLVLFRVLYGDSLLSHLTSSRSYSFRSLLDNVRQWTVWACVPIIAQSLLASRRPNDRFVLLTGLYGSIAVFVGFAFSGGAGVDMNVFFDADIALSLSVGLAFRHAQRAALRTALALPLLVILLLGVAQASSGEDWRDPDFWLHPMADDAATAQRDIAFIHAHPGRALCEMLSFCYWAGKPAEVDVFNTGQQFATGARSDADLIRQIDARAFAVMEFDALEPFALGPRVKAAVFKAYRIDHTDDDGVWLVPK
jgi:hypothetical protein